MREGGTLCTDQVEYAVPCGRLVNRLLIEPEIKKIFKYRAAALSRRYPPSG